MSDSCFMLCNFLAAGFLTVAKLWDEDTLTLKFPITLRTEAIKGMKSQTDISIDYFRMSAIFFPEATNLSV